jgi:phosphoribosylformylglycinamidine synthase
MPHDALLDPQGKAVTGSLKNIGLEAIQNVRIGKHISIEIEAIDEAQANQIVTDACKKLLANMIMEKFDFTLTKV